MNLPYIWKQHTAVATAVKEEKKLENLRVGTFEKESCAAVAFCAERNEYYSKEAFAVLE